MIAPPPTATKPALPSPTMLEPPTHYLYAVISCSPPTKKKRLLYKLIAKEAKEARATCILRKTLQDTKYCLGLWKTWTEYRISENGDSIGPIEELSTEELQYILVV